MWFLILLPLVFCSFEGRIFWRSGSGRSSKSSISDADSDSNAEALADSNINVSRKQKRSSNSRKSIFSGFFGKKKRKTIAIPEKASDESTPQEEITEEEQTVEAGISVDNTNAGDNTRVMEENENAFAENDYLKSICKKALDENKIDAAIDCLIALILNSQTDEEEQLRKNECISLCEKSDSKSKKILAEALLSGEKPQDQEKLFEKARKYTAKREYAKARDIFLALYLTEEDSERKFDKTYRCGMISLSEQKPYLARGFFTKAVELINKNDRRWPELMMRIAVCEQMIGKRSDRAKEIISEILANYPNYKPRTEREKLFIARFFGEKE